MKFSKKNKKKLIGYSVAYFIARIHDYNEITYTQQHMW